MTALAASGNTLFVGGAYGFGPTTLIAVNTKPDGSAEINNNWQVAPNRSVQVLKVNGNRLFVGGQFDSISVNNGNRTDRFDSPFLAAIDTEPDGFAKIVDTWWAQPNDAVGAIAIEANTFYVGGAFSTIEDNPYKIKHLAAIESSDGSLVENWAPNPDGDILSLAVDGNTIYAGGSFQSLNPQNTGLVNVANLAAFESNEDGTSRIKTFWMPNPDGPINTIAVSESRFYVGGSFSSILPQDGPQKGRSIAISSLAAIDTSSDGFAQIDAIWAPIASGHANAISVSDSKVYVGGEFTLTGGNANTFLAAINSADGSVDSNWLPNPSGPIQSIAIGGSTVYAGGVFDSLNPQGSGGLAIQNLAAITTNADGTSHVLPNWTPNPGISWNPTSVRLNSLVFSGNVL